jgi:hypothetical protein
MPGMKPSEKFSIVPEGVRRRFRDTMRREEGLDERPARSPMDNVGPEDREALNRMIREEGLDERPTRSPMDNIMETPRQAMAKGGMVKKYAKGGMVKVRGYGKARSKPCKIC